MSLFESTTTAKEAETVPPVTPSNKFNSVAVEVTATSSLIFGEVNVLFVTVAVEVAESNLELPPLLGSVKVLDADSECGAPISVCA